MAVCRRLGKFSSKGNYIHPALTTNRTVDMSLQITAGSGSLLSLGIAVSDIATLFTLGTRVGSWLTASSGDSQLFELLDLDELDILKRHGIIELVRFNKQWGRQMAFLASNEVIKLQGDQAERALEKPGRFTALMICIVATLDAFCTLSVLKSTVRNLLLELLRTSEYGEDVVVSQLTHRLNSWRSSGVVRGLSAEARYIRRNLIEKGSILDGLLPEGDVPHLVRLLYWLLTDAFTDTYVTASSDVAGIAYCLSRLCIDILGVSGLSGTDQVPSSNSCWLVYNPSAAILLPGHSGLHTADYLSRPPCTTVNLQNPEESLSKFPVDPSTAIKCREAWNSGLEAAKFVELKPYVAEHSRIGPTIGYKIRSLTTVSKFEVRKQHRSTVFALTSSLAFANNGEICRRLDRVLRNETDSTLKWLQSQTAEFRFSDGETKVGKISVQIEDPQFKNNARINGFTLLQAFFMGYYYGVILSVVDTDSLQIPVVEGAWGFRSARFLNIMSAVLVEINAAPSIKTDRDSIQWSSEEEEEEEEVEVLQSNILLSILSVLLLGVEVDVPFSKSDPRLDRVIGVVRSRALLLKSLVKPCETLEDVGRFILLDVDVSGIPTNRLGLVYVGVADVRRSDIGEEEFIVANAFGSTSGTNDASFHIEADWDENPESLLICVRHQGRRVRTIDPCLAEIHFWKSLSWPSISESRLETPGEKGCSMVRS
jgi:hypothetical protein